MKTFYGENLIYYCTIGSEKLNCLKKAVTVDPNGPWNCHFGLIGVHVYMYLQIFWKPIFLKGYIFESCQAIPAKNFHVASLR